MAGESTMYAIKESIDGIHSTFNEFKQVNDERIEAEKKGREGLASEMNQKLDRINGAISSFEKAKRDNEVELKLLRERTEELEMHHSRPARTAIEKTRDEHYDAFLNLVRHKGQSASHERALIDIEKKMIEQKDITVISQAGGGYALPKVIADMIEQFELKFSPVRDLVTVLTVTTTDYHQLLNLRGTSSGWSGEIVARTGTVTPQFRDIVPTWGELYAYPSVTEWAVDDLAFDVPGFLANNVGDEFALQEGTAVISGSGTNRPTGMTNTTPVTTNDSVSPLRAAAAYQYTPSVASPFAVTADSIIDAQYLLNSAYRAGSYYVFNSTTAGAIRKLKDTTNQYLWQPSFQAGQPSMLAGYPTATWEQMADIGASTFPVAFGNFKRAYLLVQRTGLRTTMDNVTQPGYIKFYIRRREGGIPMNNDAVKFIRTA